MATLSSAGISGSGLDETMIAKLVALQKQALVPLQQKASVLDSKISTFGQIKSLMSTLQDAATSLANADTWRLANATSTNTAVAVSVTDANALPGSSVISVGKLARSQSVATGIMPAATQFGAGKLTITMGSWNADGTQFNNPGTPLDIDIAAGAKLEDVVQAINSKGAGVVASVLKDAQGERLVLRSRSTGADAGFTVGASGDASLSALAFNGAATSGSVAQYAQNAEINVNGITVQSTTNEFKQTLPGLNITVTQQTTAPVTVTVSSDTEGMKKKIQAFMDAYNALNDALGSSTKYDAESKVAGVLQGDATTVGMTNSLRSVLSGTVDGGSDTLKRLSDMGIQIQKGGKLAFGTTASDKTKFEAALKDPESMSKMFASAGTDGQPNTQGLAARMKDFTKKALEFEGTFDNKNKSLQALKKDNGKSQDRVNDQADSLEKRLRAQYASLDAKMGSYSSLSAYMNQQVAQWNK
ncbi:MULTISPECIES: flagellar filament capping protein FliD [Delftia]|uniref:flagellar filament capping protein FliD n=1 Tax=Delftia TaxID=80865 RepID=UPI000F8218DD|nr:MULTISPECIES: flagellar filament capping protein FliD [Delftia]MDH0850677.1 flagellar filament capping protein FliD [Delftia tsuruhatensis]TDF28029.1 flagellar hook protein [Delftia tsuruhatensis]WEL98029.1 flagellar filament capping protein FliD [Delftia tsuruhatensis]WQM83792.1 flagellar filament capping protein FliD [Delftia tsuruhatensis]